MGELLSEVGDLVFSIVIGYIGALEFLYVVRHLYHWTFRHAAINESDSNEENLKRLQDSMRSQLAEAESKESEAGGVNAMQDGVLYKDGFRIESKQQQDKNKEQRRKEIEAELARQQKIEEETRAQLARAEADLEKQRLEAAVMAEQQEEEEKILKAERAREEAQAEEEIQRAVAAENAKRLLEAEREREAEQRRLEEQKELAAQRERKEQERIEEEENAKRIFESERLKEAAERLKEQAVEEQRLAAEGEQKENEENEKRLLEGEQRQQVEQRATEEAAEKESEYTELSEQARLLLEAEREQERKQRLIEENARKFLEAEEEMVAELQRQMEAAEAMQVHQLTSEQDMLSDLERQMDATETMQRRQLPSLAQQISVVEEPCIKKNFSTLTTNDAVERLPQTVKTQFGQTGNESYSLSSKSLHFPSADDASSVEPNSSQQSSFSTQPSDEVTTGAEETVKTVCVLGDDIELEREAPDGEDNIPTIQYTDEYLRSLDGIKQRPLVREDGSGRRRAFKKRRSSGSSNSSRDSRTSREEEIKMFTSLEEEEMDTVKKGEEDFAAIKYSSEPTLKVKGHHRRHKRSPAKDAKIGDEKASLEMLDEENSNPWGEVVPEHYKDTAFWKREQAISIDEEDTELELQLTQQKEEEAVAEKQAATNIPKSSSFEEANDNQNKEAISTLQLQHSIVVEEDSKEVTGITRGDENKNLQTSHDTESTSSPARSISPRLRRSPRIDEIDQYEERWKETTDKTTPTTVVTPTITIDNGPWKDDHGLLMEGLSDFYDFTASANPSRSRSTSRATTPTSPKSSITFPKNVSYSPGRENSNDECNQKLINETNGMIELYDDAGNFEIINKDSVVEFIKTLTEEKTGTEFFQNAKSFLTQNLRNIADEPEKRLTAEIMPTILIEPADNSSAPVEDSRYLSKSRSRSRSRSRSPLPTPENIQRSLETRRSRLVQHNDEIFEKLKENVSVHIDQTASTDENIIRDKECSKEDMNLLVESLRAERCRSTSRPRSPLLTTSNIQRSLDARREKLIRHNDEIIEKLEQLQVNENETVDTPTISVELIEDNSNVVIEESTELYEENMAALVETLRIARRKSRSRTPMRVEVKYVYEFVESGEQETYKVSAPRPRSRSVTPSISPIIAPVQETTLKDISNETVDYQFIDRPVTRPNFEDYVEVSTESLTNLSDYYDFHQMLNLEASNNKTLSKNTEEIESNLAIKQRSVDEEALNKLSTANEEVELRTISQSYTAELTIEHKEVENLEKFEHTIDQERLRQLKCTPTTPDYDRTVSKEWEDVQRIKEEIIASGYKRSTYVGESMDISSEFEELRRQTAQFQRSQSRSRSPICNETESIEIARKKAADVRQIQSDILAEITTVKEEESRGAKPKTDSKKSSHERSLSKELVDTQRIKDEILNSGFQRSTYVGESLDMSAQFEDLRRSTAEFRRSQSKSRSPPDSQETVEMARIDAEVARRELQDRILDEIERTSINFQDFSRHLNANFLESERRASDSVLIQKPEIIFQFEDTDFSLDMEPEEYHHYRRFSLFQETPVEEYPNDDDAGFMYVSEAGIFTAKNTGSWVREDYNDNLENINIMEADLESTSNKSIEVFEGERKKDDEVLKEFINTATFDEYVAIAAHKDDGNVAELHEEAVVKVLENDEVVAAPQEDKITTATEEEEIVVQEDEDAAVFLEDEDTEGSEDERRTVVDVEDEIEEDIGDYNDRGPTDESHHEQSECEEADREVDHYADRRADDWQNIEDIDNLLDGQRQIAEAAAGGSGSATYDSDSFAIDQIYDEAIRNRKQSGIMRDYDCILQDMQKSFVEKASNQNHDNQLETQLSTESDHYALWAKTRDLERSNSSSRTNGVESSLSLIESERNDCERRYLGDATVSARNATRLRSRYGYVPVLQSTAAAEIEVDMYYKPKRDYNWRKNFKLDEEIAEENGNKGNEEPENNEIVDGQVFDSRKYSLGGESITLFSRSPERELLPEVIEEEIANFYAEPEIESTLDPTASAVIVPEESVEKKQKTKKKCKKKTRKDSKGSIDTYSKDDDDSENQLSYEYSRRSSSLQMETDSPKRKSRSRRSSRSSLVNEDSIELYSPRSSIGYAEPIGEFEGEYNGKAITSLKKKTKKRKKAKETFMHEPEIKEEHFNADILPEATIPVSAAISPEAASMNVLATLSPEHSVCVTPASIESDTNLYNKEESNVATATTTSSNTPVTTTSTITSTAARVIESFDILKDGNFYPLF